MKKQIKYWNNAVEIRSENKRVVGSPLSDGSIRFEIYYKSDEGYHASEDTPYRGKFRKISNRISQETLAYQYAIYAAIAERTKNNTIKIEEV